MGRQQCFYLRPMQIYIFPAYCPSPAKYKKQHEQTAARNKTSEKRETVPTLTSKNGQVNNT